MRVRYTLHVVGAIILSIGMTMIFPLAFSLYYRDDSLLPMALASGLTMLMGTLLLLIFKRPGNLVLNHREGLAIVAFGWVAAGLMGALPFYLYGGPFHALENAVFESISGFTTTGASILTDIEALPRGLLMWRSLTHWLGGMGIILLGLAILPFLGVGGMQLYKAEVPGPTPDKLTPRIKDTALLLWKVYLLLSVLEVVLLWVGNMDFFEAVSHTFATMATGGFSTRNTSIASFDSSYIDMVITVFMFLAGINFALHFRLLKGRPMDMFRDPEFRFYAWVAGIFTLLIMISVYGSHYGTLWDTFRYSVFQVVSIGTTTGFATADYELWPFLPQALILFLMFLGGSAGSTGGGMKCMRVMLLLKQSYQELYRLVHPRSVKHLKMGGKIVPDEVMSGVWGFFVLYISLFVVSSFLLAALGVDVLTAFAAVASAIGNIGPGLGEVGPTENYAAIPVMGKWLLMFCMLLGRLEIYTIIILFIPEFWRK